MNDTKIILRRGRPRTFDRKEALAKAQKLFHKRGYDSVSIADLTDAIGINPPSFYAAFGSKLALYGEALQLYEENEGLDVETALKPERPLAAGIAEIFRQAADAYASGYAKGCMVIEGARGIVDREASASARSRLEASRRFIDERIALHDAARAALLTDYVMMTLSGLSASAGNGIDAVRLRELATMAAAGAGRYIEGT